MIQLIITAPISETRHVTTSHSGLDHIGGVHLEAESRSARWPGSAAEWIQMLAPKDIMTSA